MEVLQSRFKLVRGHALRDWVFVRLGIIFAALPGASGCFRECHTPYAGIDVEGRLIDAESEDPLAGVSLEIRLEGDDGPIGQTAHGLTDEDGSIFGVWVVGALVSSNIVVTDTAPERCFSFTVWDFAAASAGRLGQEAFPELVEPSGLEFPPNPRRAILTLDIDGSTLELSIEVTDHEHSIEAPDQMYDCYGDPVYALCTLDFGTIRVDTE